MRDQGTGFIHGNPEELSLCGGKALKIPWFSDYKTHLSPLNLGGKWGASYSLNVVYLACWGGGGSGGGGGAKCLFLL